MESEVVNLNRKPMLVHFFRSNIPYNSQKAGGIENPLKLFSEYLLCNLYH
jgi:hypothetical protein